MGWITDPAWPGRGFICLRHAARPAALHGLRGVGLTSPLLCATQTVALGHLIVHELAAPPAEVSSLSIKVNGMSCSC
jgi:hypothetical protein